MKSIEWIDRLITEKKLPSDRQAALMIGMTEQTMSKHRRGHAVTLDDKYAYNLEKALGLPHGKIVADQHAEREKDPAMRSMWQKLAAIACQVLAVAVLTSGGFSKPAEANNILLNQSLNKVYIMRTTSGFAG